MGKSLMPGEALIWARLGSHLCPVSSLCLPLQSVTVSVEVPAVMFARSSPLQLSAVL